MKSTPESRVEEEVDAEFVRPFLSRGPGRFRTPAPVETGAPTVAARPYFVTSGRTRTTRPLGIEALAERTEKGEHELADLQFEQYDIAQLCSRAISVAEIAARADMPLGVARVLVADMASGGLLHIHDVPERIADDISLIQRLIHGVRAL